MSNLSSAKIAGLGFLAIGLFGLPSTAFAGFQWVAPSESAAPTQNFQAPQQQMPSAPIPVTQAPEIISPVVISGSPQAAPVPPAPQQQQMPAMQAPAPIATPAPMPTVQAPAPVSPSDNEMAAAPVAAPVATVTPSSSDVVHGFANQVPLAVALRQILPAGYGFSVDQDVDLGVLVSFHGGKPWRETLTDALSPSGLGMREQGQMVMIGHSGSAHTGSAPMADITPLPPSSSPSSMPEPAKPMGAKDAPIMGSAPHFLEPPPGALTPVADTGNVAGMSGNGAAVESWTAERGTTLHKVLEGWTRRSNVEFEWLAEYDYPIEASLNFNGTFEEAVRNLLTGFETAHPQPVAELHANPTLGQMVLVIQTRGNNYSD